jgi:hypothetical protein
MHTYAHFSLLVLTLGCARGHISYWGNINRFFANGCNLATPTRVLPGSHFMPLALVKTKEGKDSPTSCTPISPRGLWSRLTIIRK